MPVEIHAAVRTGLGVENFRPRFAWAGSVFDKLDDVELGAFNALLRTHAHTVEDIGTLMIYLPAISIDRPTNWPTFPITCAESATATWELTACIDIIDESLDRTSTRLNSRH